jgi:hypothetical protein
MSLEIAPPSFSNHSRYGTIRSNNRLSAVKGLCHPIPIARQQHIRRNRAPNRYRAATRGRLLRPRAAQASRPAEARLLPAPCRANGACERVSPNRPPVAALAGHRVSSRRQARLSRVSSLWTNGTAQRSAAGVQASSLNKTPSLNRWQFTFRFSEIRRVSRCTICCAAQVQPTHLRRATSTSRRVAGHCWSDDRRPLRRHELSELLICLFASRTHSSVRSPRQMPCNILIEIPTNNTHASITINAAAPTTE